MNGLTLINGELLQNIVIGWDLNNGKGFDTFGDAVNTFDFDNLRYGSLYKIDYKIYVLIFKNGGPDFKKWEEL